MSSTIFRASAEAMLESQTTAILHIIEVCYPQLAAVNVAETFAIWCWARPAHAGPLAQLIPRKVAHGEPSEARVQTHDYVRAMLV